MCTVMDSFLKCVFVRAGKHTSVHDMHPHLKMSKIYVFTFITSKKMVAENTLSMGTGCDKLFEASSAMVDGAVYKCMKYTQTNG